MPLLSFNAIRAKSNLVPDSELARINYMRRNIALFGGDFTSLGITSYVPGRVHERTFTPENVEGDDYSVRESWFRRLSTFYPEFMLANRPTIAITNNDRLTTLITEVARQFLPELQRTNVDMLKLGYGVIATDPLNPLRFIRWPSVNHYEVHDRTGAVVGDILVRERNYDTENQLLDVILYPVNGPARWRIYRHRGDTIEDLVRSVTIPNRVGRQCIIMEHNADQTSLFDDIQESVGEVARTLTRLSTSISKNLRPHLAVPAGSVAVDEQGKAVIDVKGMVFPIPPEEKYPAYIQWDNKLEAVQGNVDMNIDNILVMVGLSRILVSPDKVIGQVSGTALRRMFVPFVAKLDHYAQINNTAIEQLISLYNTNRANMGMETFAINASDIQITWAYNEIFMDEDTLEEQEDENTETN